MSDKLRPKCFVIMPISTPDGYSSDHFDRVFEHLIEPACVAAGFLAKRADQVQQTNHIVADIVQDIVESDMAICDLSARNPNVMYELGLRHAFQKPVVLIRDSKTPRVFDIQGLRDVEYDENLRVDTIKRAIERIADSLQATYNTRGQGITSPVQLLKIAPVQSPERTELSPEGSLILNAVSSIEERLTTLKTELHRHLFAIQTTVRDGFGLGPGDVVRHTRFGEGILEDITGDVCTVFFPSVGRKVLVTAYLQRVTPDNLSVKSERKPI